MRAPIAGMILLALSGCVSQHAPVPAVGQPVHDFPAVAREHYQIMAASGQSWPEYDLSANGVAFVLGVGDGVVRYVDTDDPHFATPEGVRVGDTYKAVAAISGAKALAEKGWAYYVPLKSGWNAAFVQGPSMTEGELGGETKVKWLFRR